MTKYFTSIKVLVEDKEKLMGVCKKLFLQNHPHMKGMRITNTFLCTQAFEVFEQALRQGAKIKE